MRVQIYFFAQSREIVGDTQRSFDLAEGADVAHLLARLLQQYPDLQHLDIRVAVNSEYAENSQILHDGDEVAIIPPISGG